ncbi:MAG TPA: vWA domain-containing protein [Pirellulaceae bacterium]|jgi:hypothetical protein|nr:vWA domain-containing protein [Pirellulaceae bacterium]
MTTPQSEDSRPEPTPGWKAGGRTRAVRANKRVPASLKRKGIVTVLAAFTLTAIFAFVAFAVDTAKLSLTQTNIQTAADAASLAAAQEITRAIHDAGRNGGSFDVGIDSPSVAVARQMAVDVAEANGAWIDSARDVKFGNRKYNPSTGGWVTTWNSGPINTVQVDVRRDNANLTAQDSEVLLSFGWAVGRESAPLLASSAAFVESRDLVLVLDFSGSMNDDSTLASVGNLGQATVEASLDGMWDSLRAADPKFSGTTKSKFPSTGFGQVNSKYGTYKSSTTTDTIFEQLNLDDKNSNGTPKYPFPQVGRFSNGVEKGSPDYNTSTTQWKNYINYVKNLSGTYKRRYGYRTLMDYLQVERERYDQAEDLWRTPHYPFHAVKEGATMLCDFLEDLSYGDQLGVVSYAEEAVREDYLSDGGTVIDLKSDPITDQYAKIDAIQRHKQAGHYSMYTGTGYGIKEARQMLLGTGGSDTGHLRYGARPTMIVMTDGLANRSPSGFTLPANWNWAKWTDYDGDGVADYSTSDVHKRYAFYEATECVKRGITVHSMSVGAGADRNLMRAIAFAGKGIWIDVPGGSSPTQMEEQMEQSFQQIGSMVPSTKLVEVSP